MSEARKSSPETKAPLIPDKLYFRIGEVARLLGVETHTLRFWESEFPQLKVGKGGTGQRLYRRRDVEILLEIKHLLYEQGFTIPGARQHLQTRTRRRDPVEQPVPDASPKTDSPARQSRLQRLRADLSELSQQLASAVPPGKHTSPRKTAPVQRSGLHLAGRTSQPSAKLKGPTLFENTSDS